MSIIVSPVMSAKIQARLSAFILEKTPDPLQLREIANELKILPLVLAGGGCYAIRPDGQIVSFSLDEPSKLRVENDERICNIMLFKGSKKYPELEELVPEKPTDAQVCPFCKGTGVYPVPSSSQLTSDDIVCFCGGLGWLPPETVIPNS